MSAVASPGLGYFGLGLATFFFGSCYVPAKKYATYDGIIFQWFMCSGILLVGLAWGVYSNNWSHYALEGMYTFPGGILGGFFFAIANLLIPTVVNNLGLGVGFMLWNGSNIVMGYLISRLGWFGVEPTIPHHSFWSIVGILCMVASIAVYGLVKPTLQQDAEAEELPTSSPTETSPLLASPSLKKIGDRTYSSESLTQALIHPELPNFGPYMMAADVSEHIAVLNEREEKQRKIIGIVLAIFLGCVLSGCLIPYVRWQQNCRPTNSSDIVTSNCHPLNFIFSQCLGIYLTSTVAFLIYSAFHKFMRRSMPRSVMRPAYMCGILWAIGLGGQLLAAGNLGFDQAYPISTIGPAMVSMLWSALYFKEIEGTRNIVIMSIATMMVFLGTALRTISN